MTLDKNLARVKTQNVGECRFFYRVIPERGFLRVKTYKWIHGLACVMRDCGLVYPPGVWHYDHAKRKPVYVRQSSKRAGVRKQMQRRADSIGRQNVAAHEAREQMFQSSTQLAEAA